MDRATFTRAELIAAAKEEVDALMQEHMADAVAVNRYVSVRVIPPDEPPLTEALRERIQRRFAGRVLKG